MKLSPFLVKVISRPGLLLAFITWLLHQFASRNGLSFYHVYGGAVFPWIRMAYDNTLGRLPFPVIYLVVTVLLLALVLIARKAFKTSQTDGRRVALFEMGLRLTETAGWIYFLFYFLWGFNYYGPSVSNRLGLPEIKPDSTELLSELAQVTHIVNKLRNGISTDSAAITTCLEWSELENDIRLRETELLDAWGESHAGRVRVRALHPQGLLLRIATAGVYIPFACEGHVDPGLHCLQWPYTIAHEMAHGYGFTDEGDCNFIGLLVCDKAFDPFVRYSGWLTYWKYLYFDVGRINASSASNSYRDLIKGVKSDLKAIRQASDKYPDIMPRLRDAIYDNYLKSHGVSSGLASYNEIVVLMHRYKKSEKNPFLLGAQN